MSKREFRDYIEDIFQAIEDVETFIKGMSYKDFFNDRKTVHAVVRCIDEIEDTTHKAYEAGKIIGCHL